MQLCSSHLLPWEKNRMGTRMDGSVYTPHMGLEFWSCIGYKGESVG